LSTDKLLEKFQSSDESSRDAFADFCLERIDSLINSVANNSNAKIVLANYPEFDDTVFGNYGSKVSGNFLYQLRRINLGLMERAQSNPALFILDVCAIQSRLGHKVIKDPKLYINASMSYGMDAIPVLAKNFTDIVFSIQGKLTKCLILDLDNTLWGGVIGDDGMEGIQLGALGIGSAFTELQRWILQLKNRGIILAVCSKNTESIAREPFESHPRYAVMAR